MSYTTSEIRSWMRCREEHDLKYRQLIKPRIKESALVFGTLWHSALERWMPENSLTDAMTTIGEIEADPYDKAKIEALLIGYHERWKDEGLETLAVESEFSMERDGYTLRGKLDAVVKREERQLLMEHKTSSEDVEPGADYWVHLTLDDQVSNYYAGGRALGFDIEGCIYDVVKKPTQKPRMATPEDKRKYKANGAFYANQRSEDETPLSYRDRILEDICEHPAKYYQRVEVVRLEAEELRARRDMLRIVEDIEAGSVYRNPGSCRRYGRYCSYHPICVGTADIHDSRYRKAEAKHEELQSD